MTELLHHGFGPVWDESARILILGSFPSVRSREIQFYYGHPQNRFWKLIAALFSSPVPGTTEERRRFALEHHVALYDVIESCTITGSSDSSIRNVTVTDLLPILKGSRIGDAVFTNGAKSHALYQKYTLPKTGIPAVKLPSTSPANAAWSLECLQTAWKAAIREKVPDLLP